MTEIEQLDDGCVLVKVRMYGVDAQGVVSSVGIWWIRKRINCREAIVRSCKEAYGTDFTEPLVPD